MNVGQIVVLKSGGPPMTILEVDGGNCMCGWFTDGEFDDHWFSDRTIREVVE